MTKRFDMMTVQAVLGNICKRRKGAAFLLSKYACASTIVMSYTLSLQAIADPLTLGTASTAAAMPHTTHLTPVAPSVPSADSLLSSSVAASLAAVSHATQQIINVGNLPHGTYSVAGNFVNSHNLIFVSTNPHVHTATFDISGSLFNPIGTSISTIAPSGYANAVTDLSLVLNATAIYNAGVISSAGKLTETASVIVNALPAGNSAAAAPVMSSASTASLLTSTVLNQGSIFSNGGDLIINSLTNTLAINAVGGSFSAANGSGTITIGTTSSSKPIDLEILGGDYLAKTLNLDAGSTGTVTFSGNSISGVANATGANVSLSTTGTGTLTVGTLKGADPILDSNGDIVLMTTDDTAEELSVTAVNNIINEGGPINITDRIYLAAGESIFLDGTGSIKAGSTIYMTAYGGSISATGTSFEAGSVIGLFAANGDLTTGTLKSLSTDVNAVAGSGLFPYTISAFAHNSVNITGDVLAPNGNVIIRGGGDLINNIAYASENPGSVTVGKITAVNQVEVDDLGGPVTTGNIVVHSDIHNPNVTGGNGIGVYTGQDPLTVGNINNYSVIGSGSVIVQSSNGSINTGSVLNTSTTSNVGGSIIIGGGSVSAGAINNSCPLTGGAVTITSYGDVTLGGLKNGSPGMGAIGGSVTVKANGTITIPGGIDNSTPNGGGGSVVVTDASENPLSIAVGQLSIKDNAQYFGGNVAVTNYGPLSYNGGISVASKGAGGAVTLTSSSYTDGLLVLNNSLDLSGKGNGNGGSLFLQGNAGVVVNGNVNVDSAGTGSAGSISVYGNVAGYGNVVVNGSLHADSSGSTGGIISLGVGNSGYLQVNSGSKITANGATGGGSVSINTQDGITLNSSVLITANGTGNGDGGSISVTDAGIGGGGGGGTSGGPVTVGCNLIADAGTSGTGGTIVISTTGNNDVTIAGPRISAQGGSSSGDGGNITITSPSDLNIQNSTITTNAVGTGGTISLSAVGNVNDAGTITANSSGSAGNGGNINISCAGMGAITTGDISAKVSGSGSGGSIAFSNTSMNDLDVTGNGNISAGSATGTAGTISFVDAGENVNVSLSGNVIGNLTANGASVTIQDGKAGSTLTVGQVTATDGNIALISTGGAINIPAPVQVSAIGSVNINAVGNVNIGNAPGSSDPIQSTLDIAIGGKNISVSAALDANQNVTIKATGDTTITNANITSNKAISIDSKGSITGTGTAIAPDVSLLSESSYIGTLNQNVTVTSSNVTLVAATTVYVTNKGNIDSSNKGDTVTLGPSTSGGSFTFNSNGDIVLSGPVGVGNSTKVADLLINTSNNGSIFVDGSLGASGKVELKANGSGDIVQQDPGAAIVAKTVALISGSGNIGSQSTPIVTAAKSTVSANSPGTGGNAYVSQTGDVSIGQSETEGDLQFTVTGVATVIQSLVAKDIAITTLGPGSSSTGGDLIIKSTLTANGGPGDPGSITLLAAGDIEVRGALTSPTISMTTSEGSDGNVTIAAAVSSVSSEAFSPTITITADGIGSIGWESGGLLLAQQTEQSQVASYPGVLTMTTADGNIGIINPGFFSQAHVLRTSADVLIVNTGTPNTLGGGGTGCSPCLGQVDILQERSVMIGTSAAGGQLTILVDGSISAYDPADGVDIRGKSINLTALTSSTAPPGSLPTLSVGGMTLETPEGSLSSPTDTIFLASDGNITQTYSSASQTCQSCVTGYSGSIAAPNVRLIAGLGSIGESGTPIVIQSGVDLYATATGIASNVYVSVPSGGGIVSITGASAHSVNITAAATIVVNGLVTSTGGIGGSGSVLLVAQPNYGINIAGDISAGIVGLLVQGSGDIGWTSGTITASAVSLQSNSGSIGSEGAPVKTSTSNLLALTGTSGTGSVYVKNDMDVNLASSSAGGTFQLVNAGSVTVTGPLTANAIDLQANAGGSMNIQAQISGISAVNLTAAQGMTVTAGISSSAGPIALLNKSGALDIGPGGNLAAQGGNLSIQDNDHTSGTISIGTGDSLSSSSNVSVSIGAAPGNPVAGTAPDNLSVNLSGGGQVFFGRNGITASCCNSVAEADGARIIFNTAGLPASAINLGGGVNISAGAVMASSKTSRKIDDSDFVPVSFTELVPAGARTLLSFDTGDSVIRQAGAAVFGKKRNGENTLRSGEILISASKKTEIEAGNKKVIIEPDSVVLVTRDADRVVIQNLCDRRSDSVRILLDSGVTVNLQVGERVQFSNSQDSSRSGQRRISRTMLAGGEYLTRSETSLIATVGKSEVLQRMFMSRAAQDRSIIKKVLKTQACLMRVTSSHGAYASI